MKLSRTVTGLLAVALLTFMVSDALGQGRPRGQGGPGGRGGPGGGFGGFGGRGGGADVDGTIFFLLRSDPVKKELDLMPDQEDAIGKIGEQARGERSQFDFRNASDEERAAFTEKMQKERQERSKKMAEQLEEVLFPEQMERVREIAIQQLGVQVLTDESVAAKLKLSAAQKKEIEEAIEKSSTERREKAMEMFRTARGGDQGGGARPPRGEGGDQGGGGRPPRGAGGAGGPGAEIMEAMAKLREESDAKVLAVLTTTQKSDFEEMKGEKFDMPQGGFGGFGRGGPGGGGPGGFGGRTRGGDGGGDGGGRPRRPAADDGEE